MEGDGRKDGSKETRKEGRVGRGERCQSQKYQYKKSELKGQTKNTQETSSIFVVCHRRKGGRKEGREGRKDEKKGRQEEKEEKGRQEEKEEREGKDEEKGRQEEKEEREGKGGYTRSRGGSWSRGSLL
jgi:hypothetical protein